MSLRAFKEGVYREHLEEVSSMVDMRREWLCDWESTPDDVEELEARMEAHVDALVLGGEAALDMARTLASAEDPGSFYALVALACRVERLDLVQGALAELETFGGDEGHDDPTAASLRRALADALVHHMPDAHAERMRAAIRDAGPHELPVLATCVGARCWVLAADELGQAVNRACADLAGVLRALAQLPGAPPGPLLDNLGHPDPVVAQTAAVGALRRGDAAVLDLLWRSRRSPWAALPVAMAAGRTAGPWLAAAAGRDEPGEALLGLGLLGDPEGLDVLLEHLHVDEHATAAAIGLFLLTGATLDIHEAEHDEGEDDDEDPPTPASRPLRGSGISTDPTTWAAWMSANRARLRPGRRHRLGVIANPLMDLAVLSSTSLPLWLRRYLADEFVIRYGVQWAYEPDMLVARQREIVAWVRSRLDDPRLRLTDGAWYFHGRLVQ